MKKKLTTVEFRGTKEQEQKLVSIIADYKDVKGSMMPILQEAQEIYGYLPLEVQKIIARETGRSVEEIYGIAAFYSQFKLNPNGQYAIAVCLGTACYIRGGDDLLKTLEKELGIGLNATTADGLFSIEAVRCLGCCGLAPVIVVNGNVHGRLTSKDVPSIIEQYRKLG